MPKTFYVTTPIYYANDVPHLGHAYTTVAADVIARYKRMMGYEVYFLTGTDEHGKKMQEAAEAKGAKSDADILKFCDGVVEKFQDLWKRLGVFPKETNFNGLIDLNDHGIQRGFIRTTQERHKEVVRSFWATIEARGMDNNNFLTDIYTYVPNPSAGSTGLERLVKEKEYKGLYCTGCEQFYTEKELNNGICPIHQTPAVQLSEPSYFFLMSRFQQKLLDHLKEHPDFIKPGERKNEIESFVKGGLEDLSISRSTFTWGIKVPGHEKHVVYVWVDALVNYISALGWDPKNPNEKFRKFWRGEGTDEHQALHIVGKDILRFHTVYWPTLLMAAGVDLPTTVFAHGWWTVEGQKMSKSLRNVVDPNRLVDAYGADLTRYYLMRATPFGQDGNFSHDEMANRVLAELSNGVGNLLARVLAVVEKGLVGSKLSDLGKTKIPISSKFADDLNNELAWPAHFEAQFADTPPDVIIERWISNCFWVMGPYGEPDQQQKYTERMDQLEFGGALERISTLVTRLDRLVQKTEPWKLFKSGNRAEGEIVSLICLKGLKAICVMLSPFMPVKMQEMWEQLGFDGKVEHFRAPNSLSLAPSVKRGPPLFPSKDAITEIRDRFLAEAKGAVAGEVAATKAAKPAKEEKKPAKEAAIPGIITIDDFMNVELKVATVIEAVKVEKSDKLLKLQVKIGDEQRQVLAGIAKSYQPEQLVGRQVVVVANLKPAKLMGLESQGMILAAETEDGLVLAGFEKPPRAGSRVK